MPIRGEEHVFWLHVAVDDSPGVGRGESLSQLGAPVEYRVDRDAATRESMAEGLPLQQLGDEIGHPLVEADVIDRDEIGMVE